LLIVVIGSPIAMVRIDAERKRAESARQKELALRVRAEGAEHETSQQLYTALLEQARATVRSGEIGHRVRALSAIRRAAAISNTVELRREVFAALALGDLEFERQLPFPAGFTLRSLDPMFERIAVCRGTQAVEILSVSDQKLLATLPAATNRPVHVAEWSPDGRFLAIKRDHDGIGFQADLELWDVTKQERLSIHRGVLWGMMCFHPQKSWWMIGSAEKDVVILDLETGREIRRFQLPGKVHTVQFSPKGERFAAVHGDAERYWNVSVFDATNGTRLAFRVFPLVAVSPIRWHPDGRWIVVPLGSGAVHWMDSATAEIGEIGTHKAEATVAVFSPSGDYLLTSGWDRELNCFDGHTRRRLFAIRENSYVARFRADGGSCALVTDAGVRLYKVARQSGHRELPGDLGTRMRHVAFSPDSRWLAASFEKDVAVWDLRSEAPPALDESAYEAHFYFSSDSTELFGSRNNIRQCSGFRWRLHPSSNATTRPTIERLPLASPPDFLFLSIYSNQVVFTTERGSQVVSRDLVDAVPDDWTKTTPGVSAVSQDGRWLAIRRPYSASVYIYRLPSLERVAKLEHPASISNIGFSPASDELTICSKAGLAFFSTASWQQTGVATNLAAGGIFYQPDGKSLWLRRYQESGLYDRRTLQPKLLVSEEMAPWHASADGKLLAVGIEGRRLQIWNMEELRAIFRELNIDWTD